MFKHVAISISMFAALVFCPLASAQEPAPQDLAEATLFFSKVLQETDNPMIASLAQQSLLKLQEDSPRSKVKQRVEIPLNYQSKKHPAVMVMIDGMVMSTFLIDTGATYSVITPGLARQLGVTVPQNAKRVKVLSANGPIYVPLVTLEEVSIGGFVVRNLPVVVHDFGGGKNLMFSGLLGMNTFRDAEITFTSDKLILESI